MKFHLFYWALMVQVGAVLGQAGDTIREVSIYEAGVPIETCESNFENLFNNWKGKHVTNANEFQLIDYSLVEDILDKETYYTYQNHFSGKEAVFRAERKFSESSSQWGERTLLYVKPGYRYDHKYDTAQMPQSVKAIFTDEFYSTLEEIISNDFTVDTMELNYYSYDFEYAKNDSLTRPDGTKVPSERRFQTSRIASDEALTQGYFDVFVHGKRQITDFSKKESRTMILQEAKAERIRYQLQFREQVDLGDKVYVVNFEYNGEPFENLVICDAESKKVVMDYFFKGIEVFNPE